MQNITNMHEETKDKILDVFCFHYIDLQTICNEYGMELPNSDDLGCVRNYLNDNFDEILSHVNQCYCGEIPVAVQNILHKEDKHHGTY